MSTGWAHFATQNAAPAAPTLSGGLAVPLGPRHARTDPQAGAAWAGHLLDSRELADAFTRHAFAERSAPAVGGLVHRAIDRRWARAWDDVRAAQVRAGVVPAPHQR